MTGTAPIVPLVDQSLFDDSKLVRAEAQDAIAEAKRPGAAPLYARQLRHANNGIVRRAALMLEKIGDDSVVPALIDAVVTVHQVPVEVADNSNTYAFNPRGGFANPNGVALPPDVAGKLAAGAYPNGVTIVTPPGLPDAGPRTRTVMVDREYQNGEVLAALESLTKQSFGFDKDQWRRWWAAHTINGGGAGAKLP
jgi:hypothetical protein